MFFLLFFSSQKWTDAHVVIEPVESYPCPIQIAVYKKNDRFKTNRLHLIQFEVGQVEMLKFRSRTHLNTYAFVWHQDGHKCRLVMSLCNQQKLDEFKKFLDRLIRRVEERRFDYETANQENAHNFELAELKDEALPEELIAAAGDKLEVIPETPDIIATDRRSSNIIDKLECSTPNK